MQSHLEDSPLGHRSPESSKRGIKRSLHMFDAAPMHCGNQSIDSHPKELMLYDPGTSGTNHDTPVVTNHIENHTPFRNFLAPNPSSRAYSAIGTFTIQCASCFKWRIIPTKEKYEQIREKILDEYFVCEHAREWRPTIQCEDPEDISQDGSRIWAIDKPNIAQPPSGWERLLRIRGEGGTKFADVYYTAPSGKKLRSMIEVQRFLVEHPEYARQGVTLSQFSFQAPRPLQENYVRKRPVRLMNSSDGGDLLLQHPLEVEEVNPLFWTAPHTNKELLVGAPTLASSAPEKPVFYPNELTPLIDVAPSQLVKLTNEHPANTSLFNPFTWPTLPPNKELILGGARAPLNAFSEKPVSFPANESTLPTLPPEEMKLKDEHPTNSSFSPLSWVDPPTYKELTIGAPSSQSFTPEEPVSPPNESILPASMPPLEPTKLNYEHLANASSSEL